MNLAEHFPLLVSEGQAGMRLDQFLAQRFEDVSRARWSRLIDAGSVFCDGRALASSHRVKTGQSLEFHPSPELLKTLQKGEALRAEEIVFEGVEPEVIFEDEDILVINKSVGLAVHPGSGLPLEKTLVAWLLREKKLDTGAIEAFLRNDTEIVETQRPGIVHRLDQGTSGALVVAKNPEAHRKLSEQFASREAGRLYWAVVKGDPSTLLEKRPQRFDELIKARPSPLAFRSTEGGLYSFATYLHRDPQSRTRFKVSVTAEGKKAMTHFCKVASNERWSLVELKLETGRTHQIRVHMQFLDLNILGDPTYGAESFRRMMLHAHRLQLTHPRSGKKMQFEAPWPATDRDWLENEGLRPESTISQLITES